MPSQKASTLHCYELGLVDVSVSRLPAPRRNLTTLVGLATKFVSQFVNLYAYSIVYFNYINQIPQSREMEESHQVHHHT